MLHYIYHILAEKRTCAGQHRQNLLNKCPNMIKEHLSSLGPFFFLFLLPFFTCTVQPTCSRIKCMVLISCVHGTTAFSSRKIMLPYKIPLSLYCTQKKSHSIQGVYAQVCEFMKKPLIYIRPKQLRNQTNISSPTQPYFTCV